MLIHFPSEETSRLRKLSRTWHGPYRVTPCNETNITAVKVYFPREDPIQVHQLRAKPCPCGFPAGFYWYGTKRKVPGRPPLWVQDVLDGCETPDSQSEQDAPTSASGPQGSTSSESKAEVSTQVDEGAPNISAISLGVELLLLQPVL